MTITEHLDMIGAALKQFHYIADDADVALSVDALVAYHHLRAALQEGSDGVTVADYGDEDEDGAVWATTEGEVWE